MNESNKVFFSLIFHVTFCDFHKPFSIPISNRALWARVRTCVHMHVEPEFNVGFVSLLFPISFMRLGLLLNLELAYLARWAHQSTWEHLCLHPPSIGLAGTSHRAWFRWMPRIWTHSLMFCAEGTLPSELSPQDPLSELQMHSSRMNFVSSACHLGGLTYNFINYFYISKYLAQRQQ